VCAVLMPLSSVTVVAFACGVTSWRARRRLGSARSEAASEGTRVSGAALSFKPELRAGGLAVAPAVEVSL